MTLAETLPERLAEWKPEGTGRHSWAGSDDGWDVRLTADRNDDVGAKVWDLELTRTGDAPPGATVRGWADKIAGTAAGLLEPLALHEVDAGANEALLRSKTPTKKGDAVGYYEVKLTGTTSAKVSRYAADTKAKTGREQVPFALTHEAIGNLAGAIAGT